MDRGVTFEANSTDNEFDNSSRQLTLNITLKDLNLEATKIVSKALLRKNVKTNREEKDVYLSGPYFPCEDYRLKKRLKKNCTLSALREKGMNSGESSKSLLLVITEDKSNLTHPGEPGRMKVSESFESFTEVPIVSISDFTDEKSSSEKRTKDCVEQARGEHQTEDTLEEGKVVTTEKRNLSGSRSTTPLSERRRESRLSHGSNGNKSSPNYTKDNRISSSTDRLSLGNILNPLLRESLQKILNPQRNIECEGNEDNAIPTAARNSGTIFEEEIFLPKIKRRFVRHQSLDYAEQDNSARIDGLRDKHRRRSTKFVALGTPELSSTKCRRTVESLSRPVHMLSAGSQYAVKGIIGQWLKGRSTAQKGRGKANAEKQETYREVQLLKVGLSMRMLAGIA
jgi:hypothetical protein